MYMFNKIDSIYSIEYVQLGAATKAPATKAPDDQFLTLYS